jgi:hypothetical protein
MKHKCERPKQRNTTTQYGMTKCSVVSYSRTTIFIARYFQLTNDVCKLAHRCNVSNPSVKQKKRPTHSLSSQIGRSRCKRWTLGSEIEKICWVIYHEIYHELGGHETASFCKTCCAGKLERTEILISEKTPINPYLACFFFNLFHVHLITTICRHANH